MQRDTPTHGAGKIRVCLSLLSPAHEGPEAGVNFGEDGCRAAARRGRGAGLAVPGTAVLLMCVGGCGCASGLAPAPAQEPPSALGKFRPVSLKTIRERRALSRGMQAYQTTPTAQWQTTPTVLTRTLVSPGMHALWAQPGRLRGGGTGVERMQRVAWDRLTERARQRLREADASEGEAPKAQEASEAAGTGEVVTGGIGTMHCANVLHEGRPMGMLYEKTADLTGYKTATLVAGDAMGPRSLLGRSRARAIVGASAGAGGQDTSEVRLCRQRVYFEPNRHGVVPLMLVDPETRLHIMAKRRIPTSCACLILEGGGASLTRGGWVGWGREREEARRRVLAHMPSCPCAHAPAHT